VRATRPARRPCRASAPRHHRHHRRFLGDFSATERINILGITELRGVRGAGGAVSDLEGTGHLSVLTNGWIGQLLTPFAEKSGNLRAGEIKSADDDVFLTSTRMIIDSQADAAADVIGIDIWMTVGTGGATSGVGTTANFLEIDVDTRNGAGATGSRIGVLKVYDTTATTTPTSGVWITDTANHLPVFIVDTRGDAALVAAAGDIRDGLNATGALTDGAQVFANSIDLSASGSIGSIANGLEIDSQFRAAGDVGLEAGTDIYLTEVSGTLRLVQARTPRGSATTGGGSST
jgi:hypothetical protein